MCVTKISNNIIPKKPIKRASLDTIETSDANAVQQRHKALTSQKYISTVLGCQISAYEKGLIDKGLPVGGWVTSCKKDIREAILNNDNRPIKREVTYKDNSKEEFYVKPEDYGYTDANGKLHIIPHQKRWIRLVKCNNHIQRLQDQNDPEHIFYADKNHDCNDKMCIRCAKKKSYIAFIKHKEAIATLDNPVMLVLHQRSKGEGTLSDSLDHMYGDLRAMNKQNTKDAKKGKCTKWNYFWSLEVSINNKTGTFHPHYHIIVDEKQAFEILSKWIERDTENRTYHAHQDAISKPLRNQKDKDGNDIPLEKQIMEVFKYAAKLSVNDTDENGDIKRNKVRAPIPLLYEMLTATYKRRRWGSTGSLYNFCTTEEAKQKIATEIGQRIQEMNFDINSNPIIQLCYDWVYDHDRSNYIGLCEGVEINLADYTPTQKTKRFLRIEKDNGLTFDPLL